MKKINWLLVLALVVAVFTRFYRLDQIPFSLFGDEIDVGYQAWSLWTTGRDYMGNLLPTYIQSLSEARAPLLMYVSAPFAGLFGPTTWTVRLASALFGILGIWAIYFFTKILFAESKSKVAEVIAGLAAVFLATSFWHIHYSRAAFEVSLLLFLLLLGFSGIIGYLKSGERRFSWLWPLLAMAFYTYSTAALFVPLLLGAILLIYRPQKKQLKLALPGLILTGLVLLPIGYQILFGKAAGRFSQISIFTDKTVTETVEVSRTLPWVDPQIDRIFHNRATELAYRLGANYLDALSPTFLFVSGDPQPRHSVPGFGQLPLIFAPLILIGLFVLVKNWNNTGRVILAWLFLAPIPSALTVGGGHHATRLILLLPPLVVLAALGAHWIWENLKGKWRLAITLVWVGLLAWQLASFIYQYAAHYRQETARAWHYGFEAVMSPISQYDTGDNRIFINNSHEPSLLRFAFYSKLSPKKFQEMFTTDVVQDEILPGFNGFVFGRRYYFGRAQTFEVLLGLMQPSDLAVVVQGEEVPGDWNWEKTPPEGIRVLAASKDIYGQPYMYLISRQ